MKESLDSFMDQLIDWKDFELFVAEMYKDSDEVIVQHNVTEVGKSGAKRQIDVLVTQKTKLHTLKFVIECKYWKDPVSRDIIDVLASSVEDLKANKGVLFTTKGYEEGAIQYAQSNNIDIFIIRDVREDEWGKPGRHIFCYLQMFCAELKGFKFPEIKYYSLTNSPPPKGPIQLEVHLKKDMIYNEELQLYNGDGQKKGANLLKLLLDVRTKLVDDHCQRFNALLTPENVDHLVGYQSKLIIDLNTYPYRSLKWGEGFILLEKLEVDLLQSVSQTRLQFDRAGKLNLALIAENYITGQRNTISRRKDTEKLIVSKPIDVPPPIEEGKIMKNGSIIKASTEYYVSTGLKADSIIHQMPHQTISFQEEKDASI